jgi:potassium-transporting ATPase KdpC subunit
VNHPMLSLIRPAGVSMALFTLVLGIAYPLAITGVGQLAFPAQANGSLIERDGKVIGSALIGQAFTSPGYLHPRPSAAGQGYDASASSGSNLGPLNPDLAARIRTDADALKAEAPGALIPADAVTTSASGLDPHISPQFALLQADRIARARGAPAAEVRGLIGSHVEGRLLGFVGQPRINVLQTNLALDARWPPVQRRAP